MTQPVQHQTDRLLALFDRAGNAIPLDRWPAHMRRADHPEPDYIERAILDLQQSRDGIR